MTRLLVPSLIVLLLGACGPGEEDTPDASGPADAGHQSNDAGEQTDAGEVPDAGTPPPPTLTGISPSQGQAGDSFTLTGTRLGSVTTVRFGAASSNVTAASDGLTVTGTVPERHGDDPFTVDVRAIGAGFELVLEDAFTYGAPPATVEWCSLLEPQSVTIRLGETTPALSVKAYHPDVTPGDGPGTGLAAQIGWGPGSQTDDWTWTDATFARQEINDDVFEATLTPDEEGSHRFAFRLSLDGGPWRLCDGDGDTFELDQAGTLVVTAAPAIERVEPESARAGETVKVVGAGFEDGAIFHFGANAATAVTIVSGTEATMTVPVGVGTVAVSVEVDGLSATKEDAFTYLLDEDEVVVTGFSPAWLPIAGGLLTIDGANFTEESAVTIGALAAPLKTQEAGRLVVTVPAIPTGEHVVTVTTGEAVVSAEAKLVAVPRLTITPDGDLSDWPAEALLGRDDTETDWQGNELRALYAGYDDTALYIGIEGQAEAENVVAGYLGFDHVEWGSGRIDQLTDGTDALDDALSALFQVGAPEFRAQYGFGFFGTAPALEMDHEDGVSAGMGVRRLENGSDFAWVRSTVKRCAASTGEGCTEPTSTAELAIPWAGQGGPTDGFILQPSFATLRLFVRIVNSDGQFTSNQSLPADPNALDDQTRAQVSELAVVPVR